MTVEKIEKMMLGFESGNFPKEKWTHIAHFEMALWYTYHEPIHKAKKQIKEGIKKYNIAVGVKNTSSAGYHETLTELYIQLIIRYQLTFKSDYDFETLLKDLYHQSFLDKNYPFQWYTKEKLMSKEARLNWVEPDLKPIF